MRGIPWQYPAHGAHSDKLLHRNGTAAFGDERQGHGTLGIMPPETMSELRTPCRADQDVFSISHMFLLVLMKDHLKRSNMFLHEVGVFDAFDGRKTEA